MPANSTEPALLVVALSARALAQAAQRGGHAPVALDLFADLDTRAAATAWGRVAARRGGFEPADLRAAIRALDPNERLAMVYGSGFECQPRMLERLCRRRPLLGNAPATLRAVKQPRQLAQRLARLGIPHPDVRFDSDDALVRRPGDWLSKRAGASGGGHVRPADGRRRPGRYWQRRVPGRPLSALFLADGRTARIVGWNAQWHESGDPDRPYTYGGAVGLPEAEVPAFFRDGLAQALDALVPATGLVGLCGADCVVDEARWWLIEINPRPPASFDLHDRNLLEHHIAALHGRLPDTVPAGGESRAQAVVYAQRRLRVAERDWPDWVADRPVPGTIIEHGRPLCTLYAAGADPATAQARLAHRRGQLLKEVTTWQTH